MKRRWQQPLDLAIPSPPDVAVAPDARLPPAAFLPLPQARELWGAVQLGTAHAQPQQGASGAPAALGRLASRAQEFSPRVAMESHDAVLIELAGSRRLFGGLPALLAALRDAFPRPLQLALAPTPLAAVLLARGGRNCCITSMARLAGRLASLPLCHLHWDEAEQQRLRSMGIATLGALLRLPRAGLARRIGPCRLAQLDQLTGRRADPRIAIGAPQRFAELVDPGHETADRECLLLALVPALQRLEEFLRERQRGIMALRLLLQHRHAAPQECLLRCVVAEYRAQRFASLLAARFESLALPEPVRQIRLAAGRLRPLALHSNGLWNAGEHGGSAAATQAPEFIQTLMARLGEQAVYGLAQVDEHRPERQWLRPVPPAVTGSSMPAAAATSRPLGLLAQPLPLEAIQDAEGQIHKLRHGGRSLALVSGAERIESGWWDGAEVARDYYVARAADGTQWWIFRECHAPRRWFVHGCFA